MQKSPATKAARESKRKLLGVGVFSFRLSDSEWSAVVKAGLLIEKKTPKSEAASLRQRIQDALSAYFYDAEIAVWEADGRKVLSRTAKLSKAANTVVTELAKVPEVKQSYFELFRLRRILIGEEAPADLDKLFDQHLAFLRYLSSIATHPSFLPSKLIDLEAGNNADWPMNALVLKLDGIWVADLRRDRKLWGQTQTEDGSDTEYCAEYIAFLQAALRVAGFSKSSPAIKQRLYRLQIKNRAPHTDWQAVPLPTPK